jgi:hypothetical protein
VAGLSCSMRELAVLRRGALACAGLAIGAVLIGGCGGSSSTSSTVAQRQRAPRQMGQSPAPQTRALPSTSPSGEPGEGTSGGTGGPGFGGSREGRAGGGPGSEKRLRVFQARANAVCQAMRSVRAPVPRSGNPGAPPASGAEGGANGAAESAMAARTISALLRLRPPPSLRTPVGRLLNDLRQIQQMYMASASQHGSPQGSGAAVRGPIFATAQRAEIDAAAAGVPACFPRTPSG